MNSDRRIFTTRRAQHDLDAISVFARSAIIASIFSLARGELNVDVRRLQGYDPPLWRLRVGRYRVIYAIEPRVLIVERVLDRRSAYR
jgi:mRNA-degrading endonuclease RelE of RelBE toxin-antitoxin system